MEIVQTKKKKKKLINVYMQKNKKIHLCMLHINRVDKLYVSLFCNIFDVGKTSNSKNISL